MVVALLYVPETARLNVAGDGSSLMLPETALLDVAGDCSS